MKSMDKLILLDIALYFNTSFRLKELKQQMRVQKLTVGKGKKQKQALQNKNSILDISNSPFAPWEDSQYLLII